MVGFNNIPARTREQRLALQNKEQREKARLRERQEGFVRVDTDATGSAMLVYAPESQGYMSNADRFHTDTAGEQRAIQEERASRYKMQMERKRLNNVYREVERWKSMDAADAAEVERVKKLQQSGTKALRNKSGVAYNPITLKYNDGKDGQRQRASDKAVASRALTRAQALQYQNSRNGTNPITGERLHPIGTEHILPPSR